jgi:competence protein ComGC
MFNKILRISLFLLIIVIGILYFQTTTNLVAAGAVISDLKKENTITLTERQKRAVELSNALSLNKVEQSAQDNGLIQDSKFVYINVLPSSLAVSKK